MNNIAGFGPRSLRVIALVVSLSLGGCLTAPPGGDGAQNLTQAEREMRDDEDKLQQTVIAGVLTGAVAGGLIGALGVWAAGGDKKDVQKGAIGGAVVGAAGVGIHAYVKAKEEQAGKQKLRAVQVAANDMQRDNARLREYLASSERVLAEGKARLARLRTDVAAKRVSAEQAQAAREREQRNIDSMKSALANAQKTRDQYTEAAAQMQDTPQNKRNLDEEIRRMNGQIATLEKNIADYGRDLSVSRA